MNKAGRVGGGSGNGDRSGRLLLSSIRSIAPGCNEKDMELPNVEVVQKWSI